MTTTFGGYVPGTEIVSAAAKVEIDANIQRLAALIPDLNEVAPTSEATPDFDQIPPHTAGKIQNELVALKAAIDAAPEA